MVFAAFFLNQMQAQTNITDTTAMALEEIVVTSTRNSNVQGNVETLLIASLQMQNNGANLPFLLTTTPSLVVMSDDGLGVGYTYFRIRGTHQSRINMTVNGVPLNDSESQEVFWVNMTDFASNLSSVEVQRGVGTSTNGSAAFGGSVNMQTDIAPPTPYASISFNGGMYNTFRENVKIGTGLMASGFAFDAHFSKLNSNGYLYRAFSDLLSYYASAAYYHKNTMLKFLAFGGKEKTYQAWDGIDAETLKNNPRYNPAGYMGDDKDGNPQFYDNHTDNYMQQHYQLHFSHIFSPKWNMNAALHYTHGAGYYESYRFNKKLSSYGLQNFVDNQGTTIKKSDLINQKHLDNDFYGGVFSVNYSRKKINISFGGGFNKYDGAHFGKINWVKNYSHILPKDTIYYENSAQKLDGNFYAKAKWNITNELSIFGDLQYRFVNYKLNGVNDINLQDLPINKNFHFFNPKAGINYIKKGHNAYFTFAVGNREPSRNNYTEAGSKDIPTYETLFDYELGYNFSHKIFALGVNFYFMDYKNQLVLTGKIGDTGKPLTKNVAKSYRAGIEFIGGVQIAKWLRWDVNLTLSQNKIRNFVDWVDDWNADWNNPQVVKNNGQVEVEYGNTTISFSPSITAGSLFSFNLKGFSANFQTLFVGKQYLDNTQNEQAILKPYCVNNLVVGYDIPFKKVVKKMQLKLQINNIFNHRYAANGGAYGYFESADANGNFLPENQKYSPWFYAQAGINIHGGFTIEF